MFTKNTAGTDLIQSVLFGVGVAAVAVIFVSVINSGFTTSALSSAGANEAAGNKLETSASILTGGLD